MDQSTLCSGGKGRTVGGILGRKTAGLSVLLFWLVCRCGCILIDPAWTEQNREVASNGWVAMQ